MSDGGDTATARQSYTLTCDTSGATGFTYQWSRAGGVISQDSTRQMLSFSPLRLTDGGNYTCAATLGFRNFSNSFIVNIQCKIL